MADDSERLQTLPSSFSSCSSEPEVSFFAGANELSLGLYYLVLNLANLFLSTLIRKDGQKQFAFNVTEKSNHCLLCSKVTLTLSLPCILF